MVKKNSQRLSHCTVILYSTIGIGPQTFDPSAAAVDRYLDTTYYYNNIYNRLYTVCFAECALPLFFIQYCTVFSILIFGIFKYLPILKNMHIF